MSDKIQIFKSGLREYKEISVNVEGNISDNDSEQKWDFILVKPDALEFVFLSKKFVVVHDYVGWTKDAVEKATLDILQFVYHCNPENGEAECVGEINKANSLPSKVVYSVLCQLTMYAEEDVLQFPKTERVC